MIFYIILGIVGLGLLVFVHELGHFVAGKAFGVKVEEFMLGLPSPKLFKFRRGETFYGVTMLPLGGYVKFAGMDPTEELPPEEAARGFDAQPVWRKLLVLGAGPTTNVVFAAIIFMGVFMYGLPGPTTTINQILKGFPAQKIGLAAGDRIVELNGKKIASWEQLIGVIHAQPNRTVTLVVDRKGRRLTFTPTLVRRDKVGFLGIGPRMAEHSFGFFESIWLGIKTTFLIIVAVIGFLIELPQKFGLIKQTRGPVGVVQMSAQAAKTSFRDFIWLIAAFSVSLGIFNLIPLPPLDGGKVAMAAVEGVTRRKLSKNVVLAVSAVGASLLIALMIYVVVADIGRLLPGGAGG